MSGLYGRGDYGVGPYGKAVEVPFRASGGARFGGAARVQPRPTYRGRPAPFAYAGSGRFAATLRAQGFTRAAAAAGAASWDLEALWHGSPASSAYRGSARWVLDPGADETVFLQAAPGRMDGAVGWAQRIRAGSWSGRFRTAGGAHRANVQVQARGWRASATASGTIRTLLLQTVEVPPAGGRFDGGGWHAVVGFFARRFRAAARAEGRARFGIRPVLRAAASMRSGGRGGVVARFQGTFQPAPMRFAGSAAISYSWSNLTAPGRLPPDPWNTAPEAGGGWTATPALPDQWGEAPALADSWIEAPKAGAGWHEVE